MLSLFCFHHLIEREIFALDYEKGSWPKLYMNSNLVNFDYAKCHGSCSMNWRDRLREFQDSLSVIRRGFVCRSTNVSLIYNSKDLLNMTTIIDEKQIDFVAKLKNQSTIYTTFLDWAYYSVLEKKLFSLLPVKFYFKPFATPPVCDNFVTWLSKWKEIVSCNVTEEKQQLLSSKNKFYWENSAAMLHPFIATNLEFYSYISLIHNAVINDVGYVINSNFTILPGGCRPQPNYNVKVPSDQNVNVYEEIFVTTQFWGEGYFHMTIENLPRLAVYIEFLRNNSNIKIHMRNGYSRASNKRAADHAAESLAALGINPQRRVYDTVKGRVVYLPRSTPCGSGLLPEVQILAARFHDYILNTLNESRHSTVVLIIRQGAQNGRNMPRHIYDKIQRMLTELLENSRLKLEIFDDKNMLSYSETLRLFYRARMVIGLHGAGLANVIYSRPGTVVIEMICQPPGQVNPCYIHTTGILGHRYHAVPAYGCPKNVNISIPVLQDVVTMYAQFLNHSLEENSMLTS